MGYGSSNGDSVAAVLSTNGQYSNLVVSNLMQRCSIMPVHLPTRMQSGQIFRLANGASISSNYGVYATVTAKASSGGLSAGTWARSDSFS
jgi:hypothetical protein